MSNIYEVEDRISVDLSKLVRLSHREGSGLLVQMEGTNREIYERVPKSAYKELLAAWKQWQELNSPNKGINLGNLVGRVVKVIGYDHTQRNCGRPSSYSRNATFVVKNQDGCILDDGDRNFVHMFDVEVMR
ncbi:hypothetical protein SHAb15599_00106 [Acinetobacter phage SH-Ab 15599]|nr:hypothetical protein SHAb15599_00106 [Acinetobacter phage SH-Ab 15599]